MGVAEALWGGYLSTGSVDLVGFALVILILFFRPYRPFPDMRAERAMMNTERNFLAGFVLLMLTFALGIHNDYLLHIAILITALHDSGQQPEPDRGLRGRVPAGPRRLLRHWRVYARAGRHAAGPAAGPADSTDRDRGRRSPGC